MLFFIKSVRLWVKGLLEFLTSRVFGKKLDVVNAFGRSLFDIYPTFLTNKENLT